MKNCINCGHSLELNAKFCPECGSKQPEQSKEDKMSSYSASIGDKNVISGNIIGKSEEFNISGPATINKIEDETKKFITCAVSGKHLLRGRDIVVNCPKCKFDVAQDCFNLSAGRCFNCDKTAYAQYSEKLDIVLADGIIDAMERIQLDSFALSLMIDSSTKHRLETEAKERKANASLNTIGGNSEELSGFYKIQFKKAVGLVFENNDLTGAISMLSSIHLENIFHDETAYLYFLIKAIHKPQDYMNDYEKAGHRTIDVYWEDFWAFIPYLKTGKFDNGFKIINLNKARFSDNKNDILLSEVLAYLLLFSASKEVDYIAEAKSLYSAFGRNIKQPLFQLHAFITKLLNSHETEWETISWDFNIYDRFYYQYVLGVMKGATSETRSAGDMTAPFKNQFSVSEKISESELVKIGNQVWMKKNLNTNTFQNGAPILHAKSAKEWEEAGKRGEPAWCHYNNNAENDEKYGKLYNWYAVNDPRGLAPEGWHIPSDNEWTQLTNSLGGREYAGTKMKGSSGWHKSGNGDNSSGFSGLPGGYRFFYGTFNFIGGYGYWWSSTEDSSLNAWARDLGYNYGDVGRYDDSSKQNGFSVRCLRD